MSAYMLANILRYFSLIVVIKCLPVYGPSLTIGNRQPLFWWIRDLVRPRDISLETSAPFWPMLSWAQLSPASLSGKSFIHPWTQTEVEEPIARAGGTSVLTCTHSSLLLGWSCMALCPSWKLWASSGVIFSLPTASSLGPSSQQQTQVGGAVLASGGWIALLPFYLRPFSRSRPAVQLLCVLFS